MSAYNPDGPCPWCTPHEGYNGHTQYTSMLMSWLYIEDGYLVNEYACKDNYRYSFKNRTAIYFCPKCGRDLRITV